MFVGREKELALLNQSYQLRTNALVVVYGREGIGKTSLIRQFVQEKEYVYYQAREFSEEEQKRYFDRKKEELLEKADAGRVCLILDEFDLMQKAYKTFFKEFEEFLQSIPEGRVLVLLVSSSIQWVENSMVDDMGSLAGSITSFIKIKEFTFMEMVDRFPNCTTEECIMIYSILGGVPAYLNLWNPKETARRNILRLILDDKGALHREAQRFLKTALRELPYYSTILAVDKDIEFSFDEFLDFCDENPNLVAEFADWLTRVITQQAATTNKQIDENELKKTSKKAKKAANSN